MMKDRRKPIQLPLCFADRVRVYEFGKDGKPWAYTEKERANVHGDCRQCRHFEPARTIGSRKAGTCVRHTLKVYDGEKVTCRGWEDAER